MATNNSSRQLLFGILAIQMDFISREQLVAGTSAWLQDKSRKIEDILVEHGALSESDRQLLSPLVNRHISNHGDDAEKSLSAIGSIASVVGDLKALGDRDVEATIDIVASKPAPSTLADSSTPPSSRFQILRSHAKGGLGEVSVAHDTELNREVAFKEIQSQFADDANSRSRFLLEAEITARLEHPGIVPVYGLGKYDDGRPFYAMRFIKGDSLKEAADHFHTGPSSKNEKEEVEEQQSTAHPSDRYQSVEFRKLLSRFVDVCNAIAYAHSRGVLHRDLKPGNIMLGRYGETLVVDWGLAKTKGHAEDFRLAGEGTLRPSSGSAVADTAMGSAVGTPAFMPPEQADGRLDDLGPASDVYSLGATLYYLITGKSRVRGETVVEVLQNVKSGNIERPTLVQRAAPKALEAICLRAISMRSANRYQSPQSLADDIERYLADEPVHAYREPIPIRVRRWIRNNQTLVATSAAVLLVSAMALGIVSIVVNGKNAELTRLNTALDEKNNQLTASNDREKSARLLAERNADVAREQSQLAFSILSSMVTDLQRSLARLPAGSEIRRRLLLTSLERLNDVASEYVSKTDVDENTLVALQELGRVVLNFGSGEANELANEEDLSAVELARSLFGRAREIAIKLAEQDPENEKTKRHLAVSHARYAELDLRSGQVGDALKSSQSAVELFDELVDKNPDARDARSDLCNAYSLLGNAQLRMGHFAESSATFATGLEIAKGLIEEDPDDMRSQRYRFVFCDRLGEQHFREQMLDEARDFYEQAMNASQLVARARPDDPLASGDLAFAHLKLGHVWMRLAQPGKALEEYRKGVEINDARVEADKDNERAQQLLAASHTHVGEAELAMGHASAAIVALKMGLEIRQASSERDPNDSNAKRMLLSSYKSLGDAQAKATKKDESIESYRRAISIGRELRSLDPNDVRGKSDLATLCSNLGGLFATVSRFDEAEEMYRESLNIREALLAANPSNAECQRDHFISMSSLAELQGLAGKLEESLETLRACLKAAQDRAVSQADDARAQRDLCISYEKVGSVQIRLGLLAEAAKSYENYVKVSTARALAAPSSAQAQTDLALGHYKLGVVHRHAGDFQESIDSYQQAIDLLVQLDSERKLIPARKSWLPMFRGEQQSSKYGLLASHDWSEIIEIPVEARKVVLYFRVKQLSAELDLVEAEKSLEYWAKLKPTEPARLYDLACGHGLFLAALVKSQPKPNAEEKAKHQQRAELAASVLKAAVEAGYSDMRHIAVDIDLAAVRTLVDLTDVMKQSKNGKDCL